MKRRLLLPLTVAAALLLAAAAAATLRPGEHLYHTGANVGNRGVEFHAQFRNHKPQKVFDFGWFNFIAGSCGPQSADIGKTKIDVSGSGRFHLTKVHPSGFQYTVVIRGEFKHHYKKAVGTLTFKHSATPACNPSAPGPWTAPRQK